MWGKSEEEHEHEHEHDDHPGKWIVFFMQLKLHQSIDLRVSENIMCTPRFKNNN